jgi:hypothetical protein
VLVPFVNDFVAGLETEIGALSRMSVWVDYKFLKGGHRLDDEIGPRLCKSACMILLYTPLYFDTEHLYCAREFKAMQHLEEQRNRLLKDKGKGLIIPVILRGEKKFPTVIRQERLYYRFTDIELNNPAERLRVKYAKEIKEIAEYIVDRCEFLHEVAGAMNQNCDEYCLPKPNETKAFVEEVLGKKMSDVVVPFVSRTDASSQG